MEETFIQKLQETEYGRLYLDLVTNAKKCTTWEKGYERHHILPRSMGGNNSYENLVRLTTCEHILAHYYLALATEDPRMLHAFRLMVGERRFGKVTEIQRISLENLEKWAELRRKALSEPCGPEGCSKISKKARERWQMFKETGRIGEIRKHISERTKEEMQSPQTLRKVRVNLGSRWYHSETLDKDMHWYPGDSEPDPQIWRPGRRPCSKTARKKLSDTQKNLKRVFYHNDELRINKRFGPMDEIPKGFIIGKEMRYCGNRRKYELERRGKKYEDLGVPDSDVLGPVRNRLV